MKIVKNTEVTINDGFWHMRQQLNHEKTAYSVMEQFQNTGRFDAFRCDWKEGDEPAPHIFWDSDIAKWIESVAYIIEKQPDHKLEQLTDWVIDRIEENRDPTGYYNSYFLTVDPKGRWQNRDAHELYCAGHLIEAAVAYYEATGKRKFLSLMEDYADYIYQVFVEEHSANFITPGHEEIELALLRLYRCTRKEKYLELSRFFVDSRGRGDARDAGYNEETHLGEREQVPAYGCVNRRHTQSHLPVREQTTAEGHAVRACYLYTAMADLASETGDEKLLAVCKAIFENIVTKRMYVTGGIGSTPIGEAFTVDYDLPNRLAYNETCAAIALCMFAHRMLASEPDGIYSDTFERALYNGFLSSTSLDGVSFFYENPLAISLMKNGRDVATDEQERHPITQRVKVFVCSCCPPNISRFVASLGSYLYTYDEDTVYVHQYMASTASFAGIRVTQVTDYPNNGCIRLKVQGTKKIALRIPGWCEKYTITHNGNSMTPPIKKGYAYINLNDGENTILLDLTMEVQLIEASPYVEEDAGRVALTCGPLVYCLEGVDNEGPLGDIRISSDETYTQEYDPLFHTNVIYTNGYRRDTSSFASKLYRISEADLQSVKLTFIPYFGFANRGESDMRVWILKK